MEGDVPRNNNSNNGSQKQVGNRSSRKQLQAPPSEGSMRNGNGGGGGGDRASVPNIPGSAGPKNPLDSLSRSASVRLRPMERRSGLQEVDDNFMAYNHFARSMRSRHTSDLDPIENLSSHEGSAQQPKEVPVAGLPSYQQTAVAGQQGQHRFHSQVQSIVGVAHPQQQQQQAAPAASASVASTNQQPAVQQQQQSGAAAAQPPQQQQSQARMQAGYMEPMQAEPDMCTTCPNCQTTIFLMRNGATPMDASMMGTPEQGPN